MVIDASALLAIVLMEEEGPAFEARMAAAAMRVISPVNLFEARLRMERLVRGQQFLNAALDVLSIEVRPVLETQVARAFDAHLRFGKGRHPARLNLGDCFAYALAKELDEPLLFKGADFALTDVAPAA